MLGFFGLLTVAFQFGLKTLSSCWCFPITGMLWQIGGQCVCELRMKEGTSLSDWGFSTAARQCLCWRPLLLTNLSVVSFHALRFDRPSISLRWCDCTNYCLFPAGREIQLDTLEGPNSSYQQGKLTLPELPIFLELSIKSVGEGLLRQMQ